MAEGDPLEVRVLAIDDDEEILQTYGSLLRPKGIHLTPASTLDDGLRLAASRPFDVCLLDRNIGYELGTEALPELRSQAPRLRIIMCTSHRDTEAALEALRLGVHDYLVKPFSGEQLQIAIARQVEARRLSSRLEVLEQEVPASNRFDLQSESPPMQKALDMAKQVAGTGANVLLLGESGVGKNVVARAIHRWSKRANGNFVTVNCPSLSADLLENELFGHRKGAYTGAQESSEGRVAQADGGSLFLDEIGDFPLPLQPKLLRFIQEKEYERVGDAVTRQADVRLVTATNRDLKLMSESGEFRQDLYYRLNVVAIGLPRLNQRAEDIVPMARQFLQRFAAEYGCPAERFSNSAEAALRGYAWPGNVRELQNVIERAVILSPDSEIDQEQLALGQAHSAEGSAGADAGAAAARVGDEVSLQELERAHIEAVLGRASSLESAARTLGIDASTLYRKRKAFGMV